MAEKRGSYVNNYFGRGCAEVREYEKAPEHVGVGIMKADNGACSFVVERKQAQARMQPG